MEKDIYHIRNEHAINWGTDEEALDKHADDHDKYKKAFRHRHDRYGRLIK